MFLSIPFIGFWRSTWARQVHTTYFQFPLLGSLFSLTVRVSLLSLLSIPFIGFFGHLWLEAGVECYLSIPFIGFAKKWYSDKGGNRIFQFPLLGSKNICDIYDHLQQVYFQFPLLGSLLDGSEKRLITLDAFNSLYWVLSIPHGCRQVY